MNSRTAAFIVFKSASVRSMTSKPKPVRLLAMTLASLVGFTSFRALA
ncbi:MAG: hypothetical protein R3F31_19605 [Verrucomicrobiales bacterium]